jgi:putative tricarboxylic transport membrane protein
MKGRITYQIFFYFALLFAVCVAIQVFIAGLATFVNPAQWKAHTTFIHIFQYVVIIMLIVSFTGKFPKSLRWQCLSLFLLIMVMYATANLTSSIPVAGAFHPVIALILFWLSVRIIPRAWRLAYPRN